jgi:hypothetical protein
LRFALHGGMAIAVGAALLAAPRIIPRAYSTGTQTQTSAREVGGKQAKAAPQRWDAPDVDAALPSLAATPPCEAGKVLAGAAERAKALVTSLQNFTAKETIQYQVLDEFGNPREAQTAKFDYLVEISETRPGSLMVNETRNGSRALDTFPAPYVDNGLPALALIFHPYYASAYDMRCEGLGQWNGQPAWVMRFQQRKDKPAHTLSFRMADQTFPAKLKGRAWIAADSYEIVHLETNLLQGIPLMHMRSEAVSIDYAPVQFHSRSEKLWLPQAAEVFSVFETQRYHVRHTFSDFLLFSIDTQQKIEKPKEP